MCPIADEVGLGTILSSLDITASSFNPAGGTWTEPPIGVGSQANTAGSGVAVTTTNGGAARIFSDDGGANIGDSVRGAQSRFLLTVDQSAGTIRALQGQLKMLNGVDVTTGIYTALQGYVEMAQTHSVKTGATFSCVDASWEIGTAVTVDSGGEAFGIHVETTGAGTITNNGTCAAIGITKASGAASWPVGINIANSAATTGIAVGSGMTTGMTLASPGYVGIYDTAPITLAGTDPDHAWQAHAKVASAVTSGFFCGTWTSLEVTVTQTNNVSTFGLAGELDLYAAASTTLNGNAAAVWGDLEITGTLATCGGDSWVAAVQGVVNCESTFTNNARLAGVMAQSNMTTGWTNSATLPSAAAGVYIFTSSGKAAWPIGLYMPVGAATQPIRIGNFASAGATGSAIAISSATDASDSTQRNLVAVYGESSSDLGSGIHANVGRFRHLVASGTVSYDINHETYGLVGQLVGRSVELKHMHAGLMGTFEANTTAVVVNGAYAYSVAAVIGRVGGAALITATKTVCGVTAFLNASAALGSGTSAAFAADCLAAGTAKWDYLLACNGAAYFFYAATGTAYENAVKIGSMTSLGGVTHACSGVIKVKVNTTDYYIPLYAAGDLSGE